MDSRLSRWCAGLLEAGWLIAILAVPLFFNIQSERVFEPDKLALLRSLVLVMAAVWLVGFIDRRGWRQRDWLRPSHPDAIWHRPLVLPVLALVIVYVLASLFSVSPRVSWLGSYQRLQGTYTTLSYVVVFALMASTIRTPGQVRRVITVAIVTSIPVALYGLLQHFGQDPLPWGGDVEVRVAGHMGNAIFIAAYLIMIVPLTLGRAVDALSGILSEERLAAADVARASAYLFTLAIQLLTIYWSGSRGPLIGLGVGLFAFTLVLLVSMRGAAAEGRRGRDALAGVAFVLPAVLALLLSPLVTGIAGPAVAFGFFFGVVALSIVAVFVLAALRRGRRWLWLAWMLLTVFMAGWLLLFNVPAERTAGLRGVPVAGGVLNVLDEWRALPTVGSFGRMLDPSDTTGREKSGRVRILIWQGVVELISFHTPLQFPDGRVDPFNWLRPILGYGPETMYVAYNRFYPPELATVEARNASPDRSHNETFDALVITGLLGLVAWQALFLSVILFAFRALGVVGSRRDGLILVGLWVGGAVVAALLAVWLAGPIYLGVAVPVGVIVGVVTYLIYHAIFGRAAPGEDGNSARPFAPDQLLMNALVAAVLAHYVEIHFGIAISATRLHFFVYAALMLALVSVRARPTAAPAEAPAAAIPTGKRRRKAAAPAPAPAARPALWSTLLVPGLLLTLMVGILGYNFITYALPPGKTITGPADLSAAEVFLQSLTQNARADFADSPFVLSLLVLSWGLGWLIFLSEMAKHDELRLRVGTPSRARQQLAAGLLALLALAGVAARLLASPATLTGTMGQNAALLGALICAGVAVWLWLGRPGAATGAAILGVALASMALPALIAGAVAVAAFLLVTGVALLWLVWERESGAVGALAAVVPGSLLAGLLYVFLHAARYRSLLFYQGSTQPQTAAELRALEAGQAVGLLTTFTIFLFLVMAALSVALAWPALRESRRAWSDAPRPLAFGALAVLLAGALWLGGYSNVRVIQADMIYKRAKPFDDQATRATSADPALRRQTWDAAIAIYDTAVAHAPKEDFYYLFLGRALLERAALSENAVEKTALLSRAETLLLEAQQIAPLNTDHTANLARLNSRWYAATDDPAEQAERLDLAVRYYETALVLSPQNTIVRNELARLVLEVVGDCDRALALYDESALIDPFYAQTQLARADAYITCGDPLPEAERAEHFRTAAAALDSGLLLSPANLRAWIQLAEIRRQLGEYEAAATALARARELNDPVTIPTAELDFLEAQILDGLGRPDEARALAERALETAGESTAAQIEDFLVALDE